MGLNPYNLWIPMFAFFGFALVTPAIYNFVYPELWQLPIHIQFLGTLVPPFLVTVMGASWLDSG